MRKSQKKANIKPSSLVPEHMLLRENGWWHPILILDVDGCLLDWREDFCRFVNRQFAAQGAIGRHVFLPQFLPAFVDVGQFVVSVEIGFAESGKMLSRSHNAR